MTKESWATLRILAQITLLIPIGEILTWMGREKRKK